MSIKFRQKPNFKHAATRDGFGEGLLEAGKKNKRIVVLSADLTESTRCLPFKTKFPERFIQLGVAEQSMASIAAGLALGGKIPFITSYAIFSPGRNWEQIRTNIALQKTNVKIIGSHAGLNVGADGATHQMLEDIALTRVLPNMTVIVPCDALEARKATLAAATIKGPVYLRLTREPSPVFTKPLTPFKVGRAETFYKGNDATIIAAGPILFEALKAAVNLKQKNGINVRVINCHTIKPLDTKTILAAAKQTGAIVTVEEHMVAGGLGSAVAELLAEHCPVPMEFVGVKDKFGESGKPEELLEKYGLKAKDIMAAAIKVIKRK
ncbi:MAG: transketolase family protein [Patescibacteria group bacterium]|jgi:transketolase